MWHSKYSAILSKIHYTPTDCFFGDFAHWDIIHLIDYFSFLEGITQALQV